MKLEARNDLKSRTDEYREWQRGFLPKKHAVMIGKTLEEIEGPNEANKHAHDDDDINDELLQRSLRKSQYGHAGGQHQSSQELNTVLDSLSRLAQLEQRISSLEHENQVCFSPHTFFLSAFQLIQIAFFYAILYAA